MFTIASLGREHYQPDTSSSQLRPAGIATKINESAKEALTWGSRPETPEHQKKYRALNVYEPGKIARHYGAADDPVPQCPDGGFGIKGSTGESVAAQMGGFPTSEMQRYALEQSEAIYASSRREPLGRGYQRGTRIPEGMGTERPFGITIDAIGKEKARQALHIMFPSDKPPEPDGEGTLTHTLYVRSHGAYLPGEQRRREYDWQKAGVDPTTHAFGAVDKDQYRDGVRKALQPQLDQSTQKPAVVANKILTDFKLSNSDKLGQTRKLGTGDRPIGPDHVFGVPSLRNGVREPSVEELLKTSLPPEQQQPDADLGKSLREGWRNIAPENRVFGAPSIRTDLPTPTKKSVSCMTNYGNEPDALQLLRPPRSVELGIHEEHYMQLRSKDEIRDILADSDIVLGEEAFSQVFQMASEADGEAANDKCCLDTFFRARHHVLSQST